MLNDEVNNWQASLSDDEVMHYQPLFMGMWRVSVEVLKLAAPAHVGAVLLNTVLVDKEIAVETKDLGRGVDPEPQLWEAKQQFFTNRLLLVVKDIVAKIEATRQTPVYGLAQAIQGNRNGQALEGRAGGAQRPKSEIPCRHWAKFSCYRGASCQFNHDGPGGSQPPPASNPNRQPLGKPYGSR